jgi:indole-3-glycerol phosphate synthase
MADYLTEKAPRKRAEIAQAKRAFPLAEVEARAKAAAPPRGFVAAIKRRIAGGDYALITEIKKTSPSNKRKGGAPFRSNFDPPALARSYADGGAACLSVLTDEDFDGKADDLKAVHAACMLPILRKDFMLDPYQVAEARAWGADCILIIMAMVDDALARTLQDAAFAYGMDVLVEVHDEDEIKRALRLDARLIGINNRNLKTLETTLATSEQLAPLVPKDRLIVGESGIATPADLARLSKAGIATFLIGESLMRHADVAAATRALVARDAVPRAATVG